MTAPVLYRVLVSVSHVRAMCGAVARGHTEICTGSDAPARLHRAGHGLIASAAAIPDGPVGLAVARALLATLSPPRRRRDADCPKRSCRQARTEPGRCLPGREARVMNVSRTACGRLRMQPPPVLFRPGDP
jgi:hypothetical protein